MLEQAFSRNPTRANAAAVLAAITYISRHEPRAAVVRASVLMVVDPGAAETELRAAIDNAVARGDYRAALASAGRLADLYRTPGGRRRPCPGRPGIRYTRQAGLGPWTLAGTEVRRLQVLNAMGHASQVFAEIHRLHAHMRTLPAVPGQDESMDPWDVRETLMYTAREAALRLERWDETLTFSSVLTASLTQRHASAADIARARFPDYNALLRLGRTGEALDLLLSCRQAFQDSRDIEMLGGTLGALANVEHQRGHGDAAVRLERDALRYEYLTGNVPDIAVTYRNLGTYLHMHARQPASALASHLTAALIHALAGIGGADESARNAAIGLRALSPSAVPPATIPDLCRQLGDIPGTDPARLIARLSPDPETAERTLYTATQVRKLATTMAVGGKPEGTGEARRKRRFTWRAGRRS